MQAVKYTSDWHTLELIGDKTLSKIVQTMLKNVGLPFELVAALHEWLTTNRNFRHWGVHLPNSNDPSIDGYRENAYEVPPPYPPTFLPRAPPVVLTLVSIVLEILY